MPTKGHHGKKKEKRSTDSVCRVGSFSLGFLVGPVEKPRLPAACVPVRVFSQMAADKQQPNMVLILLLAPVQLVILWFENTRDSG